MGRFFVRYEQLDVEQLQFTLGVDRQGKNTIAVTYGPAQGDLAMVSAPAVTMWPRCSGDGNFGTMWGPTDASKAKFTLDLTDNQVNNEPNAFFANFMQTMEAIDDKLLDFVTEHQLKLLGRKNLGREEIKMLQIRSVRQKVDKITGALNGHAINLSVSKFAWDGLGGRYVRNITICDHAGAAIPNGAVAPGDVVAATMYANSVYNGMAGDKFGIHWAFQDVSVICQRSQQPTPTEVNAFSSADYSFAKPYSALSEETTNYDATSQFGQEGIPA